MIARKKNFMRKVGVCNCAHDSFISTSKIHTQLLFDTLGYFNKKLNAMCKIHPLVKNTILKLANANSTTLVIKDNAH